MLTKIPFCSRNSRHFGRFYPFFGAFSLQSCYHVPKFPNEPLFPPPPSCVSPPPSMTTNPPPPPPIRTPSPRRTSGSTTTPPPPPRRRATLLPPPAPTLPPPRSFPRWENEENGEGGEGTRWVGGCGKIERERERDGETEGKEATAPSLSAPSSVLPSVGRTKKIATTQIPQLFGAVAMPGRV